MLQILRERAQIWAARVIIFILIIPFALWGIQEYAGTDVNVSVASVNGTDIGQRDFQQAYEQEQQRLSALLGGAAGQQRPDETKTKRAVIDRLVEDILIEQAATGAGLRVSNIELAEQIHSMPELLDNGAFSKQIYEQRLRDIGLTPTAFEQRLRHAVLSEQLNHGVTVSAVVTSRELDTLIRLREQQREIGYLILPTARFAAGAEPDAAAISAYYQQQRVQFTVPEQVSIDYLELTANGLAQRIALDQQELRKLYEEQAASYTTEERRRARHILIIADKVADAAAESAAKTKAEAVVKRLRAGAAFEKLAAEFSQDTATAGQGGDIGFVGKGVLDKAVEEALFALQAGAVSEPVRAADGFHILKLVELQPARTQSFDEVRQQIESDTRKRRAEQQYFEKLEILTNLAYENPDSLAVAAEQLGLGVKSSALFGRSGGEGVAAHPKVVLAAFSDEVLGRGFNSEPIEIGDHHSVVLHAKQHQTAAVRTLDEVRPLIIEQLRKEAAQARVQAAGVALQARLAKGESAETMVLEYGAVWMQQMVRRDTAKISTPLLRTAFSLARPGPEPKSITVGGTMLASGDYAVVVVYAVRDGDPATLDSATRLQLQRQLQRSHAAEEYQGLLNGLKQAANIVVHADKL